MATGLLSKNPSTWTSSACRVLSGTKTRRATVASVMAGLAGQAILIVTGILAARILGVEGRGYLAMITVFVVIVAQIGGLGLPQAVTFYISKTKRATAILKKLRPIMITQALLLLAIHLIVVLVYTHNAPGDVKEAAFFTLFATPGSLSMAYGLGILQGQGRFRLFNIVRLLPVASYAILLVLLFFTDQGKLSTVAMVWSITTFFTGLVVMYLAYGGLGKDSPQLLTTELASQKKMVCFGLKGLFGWSSPLDSFRIDYLLAGFILSPGALGLYVVGQAFTNLPKFISQSVGMIAYPTVARNNDIDWAKRIIWRYVLVTGALNTLIVAMLWLAMPLLVPLFFGNAFLASIPLARILIIGALMLSFRRIIVECARGLGRPEISTYAELAVYPWLMLSIPIIIIPFGITGLSISVASGQLVSLIVAIALTISSLSSKANVLMPIKIEDRESLVA